MRITRRRASSSESHVLCDGGRLLAHSGQAVMPWRSRSGSANRNMAPLVCANTWTRRVTLQTLAAPDDSHLVEQPGQLDDSPEERSGAWCGVASNSILDGVRSCRVRMGAETCRVALRVIKFDW